MKQLQRERSKRLKSEHGRGRVYLQHGAWFLQYYTTENMMGGRVRAFKYGKVADKGREHGAATCEAVRVLHQRELTKVSTVFAVITEDMKVVDFLEAQYVCYWRACKPSEASAFADGLRNLYLSPVLHFSFTHPWRLPGVPLHVSAPHTYVADPCRPRNRTRRL